jgi:hypothetical protein
MAVQMPHAARVQGRQVLMTPDLTEIQKRRMMMGDVLRAV